ncbi:hypothetical protein Ssi03_64260 [Sphaerisporangium siamense]|uniref:DUF397 domain-containing protein n=1 Tax=Sphaerisporangium siamense TaxID=795645 RepID=A0A7W7D483_9ACTN|nr:DUF397 domain-containing protein [Sphaerisporangium siamense]MBB4699035.1 hypothetical protein [Sphaerisporangium siamense]GII88436.1 hypothetical protein Ssi03_64260 [Sphaerisporangium siamense]
MQTTDGAGLVWRKSRRSSNGNCVEIAAVGADLVGVRDSKNPDGPELRVPRREMMAFMAELKA